MDRTYATPARSLLIILFACWISASAAATSKIQDNLNAEKIPWEELHFQASKLFVTAKASMSLERLDDERLLVVLSSKALGRTSKSQLWLDIKSARASREEKLKISDTAELRSYTYNDDHALKERYHERPVAASGEPADKWQIKGSERQNYPGGKATRPVTSPSALLYVLAASSLRDPGDKIDVTVFADRRLVTAQAEVVELVEGRPLRLVAAGGASLYQPERVLRLRLTGRDPAGGAVDLDLFGLEGDLEVLLDADKRLPLSVRGAMPIVGKVSIRLEEARLKRPAP